MHLLRKEILVEIETLEMIELLQTRGQQIAEAAHKSPHESPRAALISQVN